MLKRYNLFLDPESVRSLKKIGKKKGSLKVSQLIRIAIDEFIAREAKETK